VDSDVIEIERKEHVATVWLNRPEKLNALNLPMWTDIPKAVQAVGDDGETRAIVIAGRGRAFTAGIDITALASFPPGTDVKRRHDLYQEIKRLQRSFTAFAESPLPVIAAIHGACIGAGVDLITATDIRLAAANALFSVRETRLGMIADVGTMQRLPKIIPAGYAAELIYTGRDVTAAEAERIGLVNHVYADSDALFTAAQDLAGSIAANSPLTIRGIKHVLRAGASRPIEEALDYVALWNAAFLNSDDFVEGLTALMERRTPNFKGE